MLQVCSAYCTRAPVIGRVLGCASAWVLVAALVLVQLVAISTLASAQTTDATAKQETIVQPQAPAEAAIPDQVEIKKEPTGIAPATPGAAQATSNGQAPATAVPDVPQEGPGAADAAPEIPDISGVDPKTISAGPTLLFDATTGEVLSQTSAGETWYPASLTKLMTAYVVFKKLRLGQMKLDQPLTVSKLAARQPASKVGAQAGTTVTTDKALAALLVYSANDMAYVLAENASGTIAAFSSDMNAAAQSLGMSSSYFVNPNGLYDPRQITTARDLGLLARAMLSEFPEYNNYYGMEFVDVGRRRLFNRNMLLRLMEEADGMKTGFVCDSGFNLVATAQRGNRRLVAVILGTRSGYARAILAKDMLEKGFATTPLSPAGKVAEIVNQPIGIHKPTDMTPKVCRNKDVAEIVDPTILSGWGVSFGTFETAQTADDTLHRNMLLKVGLETPGYGATYRPLDKTGFIPILWGMDEASARKSCDKYRLGGISCSVVPEYVVELYGQLHAARLKSVKAAKRSRAPAVAQGSDGGVVKKKTAQKKSKAKAKSKPAPKRTRQTKPR